MSTPAPEFQFTIPGHTGPLSPCSPLWTTPLSGQSGTGQTDGNSGLSIGDYFTCAREFLIQNNCQALGLAAADSGPGTAAIPSCIGISLEKHGAFYHPSRIDVQIPGSPPLVLALNGAAASPGLEIMETEYRALQRIKTDRPDAPVPRVYGFDRIQGESGEAAFFLAEWFDGFHEFHITTPDPGNRIVVWESCGALSFIRFPEACRLYEKASEILTGLYNPDTFEQVFPWHHAAGDFVVRSTGQTPELRLITVRGYCPMITLDPDQAVDYDLVLNALLVFLMNLSLRMRIDRIDGTGDYRLLGPEVIPAALTGFFKALQTQHSRFASSRGIAHDFRIYISDFTLPDYEDLLGSIVDSYHPRAPEHGLLRTHLNEHAATLEHRLRTTAKKSFFIDKGA